MGPSDGVSVLGPVGANPVLELGPVEQLLDQVMIRQSAPAVGGGVQQLAGHDQPRPPAPAPLLTRLRRRTVANVDSMVFVERMWRQCEVG